jgi:hypothetical protein
MTLLPTPDSGERHALTAPAHGMTRRRAVRWVLLAFAALTFGSATLTRAQDAELEYKLKAAFLFNFLKFTEYPTNQHVAPDNALVIGCLPDDPAAPILAAVMEGKTLDGRPLRLVAFKEGEDIRRCHLLFIGRALKVKGEEAIERLKASPVLTVGEVDQFAHRGGMINFVRHERTFRFEINLKAAERAGLRISSKLGSMATIINNPVPK